MSLSSVIFFLGLSMLVLGTNGKVVPFIYPCPINDDACVLASAQKAQPYISNGNKDLNIQSFDPLHISALDGSVDSLSLGFENLEVIGASKCELIAVKRPEELKVYVEADCPISAHGQYKAKGKLLEYDIFGHGPFNFETDKIKISVSANLIVVDGNDGKKHYKINKFDFNYDPIGKVNIELKNLYDGDEARAEPINKLLASEGKTFLVTLGKNVIKKIITVVVHVIRDVIIKAPIEEINV